MFDLIQKENQTIIANVDKLKKEKNITYADIARTIGISCEVFDSIIRFRTFGTFEIVEKLSKAFDVPEDYFYPSEMQRRLFEMKRKIHLQSRRKLDKDQRELRNIESYSAIQIKNNQLMKEFLLNKRSALDYNAIKNRALNGHIVLKGFLSYTASHSISLITINKATGVDIDKLILYQEFNECPVEDAVKIHRFLSRVYSSCSPEELIEFNNLNETIEKTEMQEIQDYAVLLLKESKRASFVFPPHTPEYSWCRALCAFSHYGYIPPPETYLKRILLEN